MKLLTPAIVAALILTGCGGGSGGSTDDESVSSRSETAPSSQAASSASVAAFSSASSSSAQSVSGASSSDAVAGSAASSIASSHSSSSSASLVSSSGISSSDVSSSGASSSAAAATRLRVVSTPNPSIFPMLVALYLDPTLSVDIVPVTGSSTIDSNLSAGLGDALLSMTYVAAKKSDEGAIPPMRLRSVNYFSGFMLLSKSSDGITSLEALKGKNILISGPIGSGQNGGPDLFFQAYLAQEDLGADDFRLFYLPLNDGVAAMTAQTPLDDGDGNLSNDAPADAYLLVEPAATGMVLNTMTGDTPLEKSLNCQRAFALAGSWAETELPLGGFSVLRSLDDLPENDALIAQITEAYNRGAEALMSATTGELQAYANAIAEGIDVYFGAYGIALPAPAIVAALYNGGLIYRYDVDLAQIQSDLDTFLTTVTGHETDPLFFP